MSSLDYFIVDPLPPRYTRHLPPREGLYYAELFAGVVG